MTIYRKMSLGLALFMGLIAAMAAWPGHWAQIPASGKQLVVGVVVAGASLVVCLWRDQDPNRDVIVNTLAMPILFIGTGLILGGILFPR